MSSSSLIKSKRQRRQRNNKSRDNRSNMTIVPRPFAFPDRVLLSERYCESIAFNSGAAGVPAQLQFRMNSSFDPNLTYAGHQPYARDSLAALYGKYRVLSFHIHARLGLLIGSTSSTAAVGAVGAQTNPGFNSSTEAAEQPFGKLYYLNTFQPTVVDQFYDLPRLMGQNLALYRGDDSNESAVGSNPANAPTFSLVQDNPFAGVSSGYIVAEITYVVEYFILTPLAQS